MALFWAAVSSYKKLYFHQVGFYLLKKIKVKKENKKALFAWNSIYMTYLCSRLDKPMTPIQAHLDLWLATDKKTSKLASIYSRSSYRVCVCVCVWRCITCLVTLPSHQIICFPWACWWYALARVLPSSPSAGMGCLQSPEGTKAPCSCCCSPVHQPTPPHPTPPGHWEQHCQRSTVTAIIKKCSPHKKCSFQSLKQDKSLFSHISESFRS